MVPEQLASRSVIPLYVYIKRVHTWDYCNYGLEQR